MVDFKLSDINIGLSDGEKEASEDGFLDMFYTGNNKYNEIMGKHKFIISGRKGTGKTILAKYIQTINDGHKMIVDYQILNDIQLHEYIEFESPDIGLDDRLLFQEYYIYFQFGVLLQNKKVGINFFLKDNFYKIPSQIIKYIKYRFSLRNLKKYYSEIYDDDIFKDTEVQTTQKVVTSTTETAETNLGVNALSLAQGQAYEVSNIKNKKRKNFAERQKTLSGKVLKCLKYVDVILIIDDLDEIRISCNKHRIDFLINLIETIDNINSKLLGLKYSSKCIVLLREDIIRSFAKHNANIQKILTDGQVSLNWFEDSSDTQLSEMIMHKIKKSCNKFSDIEESKLKELIFKRTQSKDYPFDKIINCGFGRPRDVITFLKIIIEGYGDSKIISMSHVNNALLNYSNMLIGEIQNEMTFKWGPEMIEEVFSLLRNYGKKTFTLDEINHFYKESSHKYPHIEDTIENVMIYLYELGVVGTYIKRNKKTPIYTWSYRGNGNLIPNFTNRISVHYGVRKAINIR